MPLYTDIEIDAKTGKLKINHSESITPEYLCKNFSETSYKNLLSEINKLEIAFDTYAKRPIEDEEQFLAPEEFHFYGEKDETKIDSHLKIKIGYEKNEFEKEWTKFSSPDSLGYHFSPAGIGKIRCSIRNLQKELKEAYNNAISCGINDMPTEANTLSLPKRILNHLSGLKEKYKQYIDNAEVILPADAFEITQNGMAEALDKPVNFVEQDLKRKAKKNILIEQKREIEGLGKRLVYFIAE